MGPQADDRELGPLGVEPHAVATTLFTAPSSVVVLPAAVERSSSQRSLM